MKIIVGIENLFSPYLMTEKKTFKMARWAGPWQDYLAVPAKLQQIRCLV